MAYVELAVVKKVLKDTYFDYPASISDEVEFAESYINGRLAGHYNLPFDNTAIYATVPNQISWIAAHLVGYKLWDHVTALEGQSNDTAAQRWKKLADEWLDRIVDKEEMLVLVDGTVVTFPTGSVRYYPSGTRTKADSADNDPYFKREQAHEW